MWWYSIIERCRYTNINQQFKQDLYNCILQHPQVVQSPISNYFLKLSIYGQVEPHLVPKFSFQALVIELHNSILSTSEEGGIKKTRDADNNITISDSTLHNILPPQLKKMNS